MGVYVVGDVHGCFLTLKSLLFDLIKINKEDTVFFLGDYIDRGPRIKKTIDFFIDTLESGWDFRFLMGNHEFMFVNSLNGKDMFDLWMINQGKTTLESFKIWHYIELDQKYKDFFENLQYYFKLDDFILVHGTIDTESPSPLTNYEAMIWGRNYNINKSKIENKRVIVGHTPKTLKEIKNSIDKDVIFLDGGCVYKSYSQFGYLCGLNIDTLELFAQRNID